MGLNSVGSIIARTLKRMGFYIHSDREFPSLIMGGHANVQIDFGLRPIHCLSNQADIVVALDRMGLEEYVGTLKPGGILIHGYERHQLLKNLKAEAEKRNLKLLYLPARQISYNFGGNETIATMVLIGLLWKALGFDLIELEAEVKHRYGKNPEYLRLDLLCLNEGYSAVIPSDPPCPSLKPLRAIPPLAPHQSARLGRNDKIKTILLDGNQALVLGAIHAGVRAYYAYPMSPSSSILTNMANWAKEFGIIVKQGEDEITVAQMALGSMHMGTRALAATSGGGFDLMTETVSLAGMIECPLVIILAQRPGPATGLPTWTAQADLNLAIFSAHGEFPRIVMAASDQTSAFELIQHAFNLAEEFQTPVILLTEKQIAEAQTTVPDFELNKIPITRHLVEGEALKTLKPEDRYKITDSGVSKRWIPGSSPAFYFANSDEHWESGVLTEDGKKASEMIAKRMRKQKSIEEALPEPVIYGEAKGADISFIGWGSSKGVMFDVIQNLREPHEHNEPHAPPRPLSINYLHFDYLWPLKTSVLNTFFEQNKNVHLIEGNYQGQLGNLIEGKTGLKFKGHLLKWDGRPFFLEDVIKYVHKNSNLSVQKNTLNNIAYVDGQNLHLGVKSLGWSLDYKKFRVYLKEKYGVGIAYLFLGFIPQHQNLYTTLQQAGYVLQFKPVITDKDGNHKGNVDADMVLKIAQDRHEKNFVKAILVSSDGDFYSIVEYLNKNNALEKVISPHIKTCSSLLKASAKKKIVFMNNLREKLEYEKGKRTA